MIFYILIALLVYSVQLFLEPCLRYISGGKKQMLYGMGARDKPTDMSVIGGRLNRASNNMKEALVVFLTLALLAEIKNVSGGLTEIGALTFIIARIVYVPAYAINIGGIRSIVWAIGIVGCVLMLIGMWPSLGF